MNISIRYKLLLYMLVSIIFFTILLFVSNTFLVEKYYLERTKKELIQTSDEIEEMIKDANYDNQKAVLELREDSIELINQLERKKGQSLLISSVGGNVFYPYQMSSMVNSFVSVSSTEPVGALVVQLMGEGTDPVNEGEGADYGIETVIFQVNSDIDTINLETEQVIAKDKNGAVFFLTDDNYLKVRNLSYQRQLENGLSVYVSTPMNVISDGIAISNQFSTIIGIITILFTVVWSFFISHRFTKPIKKMSQITSKMANLCFAEKIVSQGNDEINQLANHINELSDELDGTIKELNLRNAELEEEVAKEREIDKMRRDFISNVSHELKTPIFLIQGYADGLKGNMLKEQQKKEFYCDVIIEEADKMNLIVRDLLSIVKMQSDYAKQGQIDFNVAELMDIILAKYKLLFVDRNISLERNYSDQIVVLGDPLKIEQVITNYLNNAIEYVNQERLIRVTIEIVTEKIRISIFNSGDAVPEQIQQLIWSSFYKADESRSREIGGAGLGLSIVQSIMEAHQNLYGVENSRRGVSFWFELDLK